MRNYSIGKKGEGIAVKYLQNIGYKILDRNYRIRGGEIDIVAIENNTLVYIEAKTRSSAQFGTPEEAITPKKIKFIERTAAFYKLNANNLPINERIDVVTIMLNNETLIKLLKNVTN